MAKQIISKLFDNDSFVKTNAYVVSELGIAGDGVVTGYGAVSGRLVYAAVYDKSVINGAFGRVQAGKIVRTVNLAVSNGAPFVLVIDSSGMRLAEGAAALSGYGEIVSALSKASGVIPLIAVISGECSGMMAVIAGMCDFTVMNRKTGHMYLNSELVIKGRTGVSAAAEGFASGGFNAASGGASVIADSEEDMYVNVRTLLQLLPDNNSSGAPEFECTDINDRYCGELDRISPGKSGVDAAKLISSITDSDAPKLELYAEYAKDISCFLAVIGGITSGVIVTGSDGEFLTAAACDKAAAFTEFCNAFNIPLVTLVHSAGFAADIEEEKKFVAGHAAALAAAYAGADIPKISIVIGKAYGGAYVTLCSKSIGADYSAAWENAEIAPLSPEASAEIIYRDDIIASTDIKQCRDAKIKEYREFYSGPGAVAANGGIDEIIKPGETRAFIISALMMLSGKRFFKGGRQ